MAKNEQYSHGDFTHQTFKDRPAAEFNDSEIHGSCFYQENRPRTNPFPDDMTGVTFIGCNMDNVVLPPGNTIDPSCCNRQCQCQNDGYDWVVDADGKPVEPLNVKSFLQDGMSVNPKDIPTDKMLEMVVMKKDYDAATKWTALATAGDKPPIGIDFWYKEKPAIVKTEVRQAIVKVGDWDGEDKLMFDVKPTEAKKKGSISTLKGDVTYYTIRGKSWRWRGETP